VGCAGEVRAASGGDQGCGGSATGSDVSLGVRIGFIVLPPSKPTKPSDNAL
jgi:hypothetical protein